MTEGARWCPTEVLWRIKEHKSWHVILKNRSIVRPRARWSGITNRLVDRCDMIATAGISSESCHVALVHSGCWKRYRDEESSRPSLIATDSFLEPGEQLKHVCEWVSDWVSDWECVFVRRGSRCRSVCERARGWGGAGRGRVQRSSLAPERTAPDRLFSTPGSLPTTAGDWPTACQSALAPPPCPMRDAETQEGLRHFFSFFFIFFLEILND